MSRVDLTTKPNYRAPWSEKDIAQVARLLRDGHTIPAIAELMGRSQEAVRNRAAKSGFLSPRALP